MHEKRRKKKSSIKKRHKFPLDEFDEIFFNLVSSVCKYLKHILNF